MKRLVKRRVEFSGIRGVCLMPFIQLIHRGPRKCLLALAGLSSCFVWCAPANADDGGEAVLRE